MHMIIICPITEELKTWIDASIRLKVIYPIRCSTNKGRKSKTSSFALKIHLLTEFKIFKVNDDKLQPICDYSHTVSISFFQNWFTWIKTKPSNSGYCS